VNGKLKKFLMIKTVPKKSDTKDSKLPAWFNQEIPDADRIQSMRQYLKESNLHTVCQSAHCPNMGKCWEQGEASFMILGDTCTRACRFCAVNSGQPLSVDPDEPRQVAEAVKKLNLKYVVITSVTRDDLMDRGADQFSKTVSEIKKIMPATKVEVLIPDFSNMPANIKMVTDSKPDVISHNLETVKRLSGDVRPQAKYEYSLNVLETIKILDSSIITKSGIMVGLGETKDEIVALMRDLIDAKCDILTIGQYLAPTMEERHVAVKRYYLPKEFDELKQIAMDFGFKNVMSAPLVRSSFIAEQSYKECFSTRERSEIHEHR